MEGGFDGPTDPESSCFPPGRDYPLSGHLTYSLASLTSRSPSLVNSFHFTKCPKTDECVDPNLCPLQIQGSKCVNTEDSYRCECPSGHKVSNDANGKAICQKTLVFLSFFCNTTETIASIQSFGPPMETHVLLFQFSTFRSVIKIEVILNGGVFCGVFTSSSEIFCLVIFSSLKSHTLVC